MVPADLFDAEARSKQVFGLFSSLIFTDYSSTPLRTMMIKRIFLGVSQGLHYPSFTSLIGEKVRDGERSLLGVSLYAKLVMSLSVTIS